MTHFATIATAAFLLLLASNGCDANNSTWGRRGPGDNLLHRELVVKSSRWLRIVESDVVYPPRGYPNFYNITCISAIDGDRKNGGSAAVVKGGVGLRNATVHMRSQRSSGLNFTIEIYGR